MTINPQQQVSENVAEAAKTEQRNDKDYNFAQMRKQIDQEREARLRLEQENAALKSKASSARNHDEDDNYDEPYIDKRYLKKNLEKTSAQIKEEARKEAQSDMYRILQEEKRNAWLKANPDFSDIMQHAQKFAETDPELAETILEMPEGFERQKLVYKNIKALGIHKPAVAKETIQDKVDRNRKSPYYQPSQMGAAPYSTSGDFSAAGQKNAYDHMKALQQKLRLG